MQIYIDCISQICKKYAVKICVLYVKYAEVYLLHILHLYALSTLLSLLLLMFAPARGDGTVSSLWPLSQVEQPLSPSQGR